MCLFKAKAKGAAKASTRKTAAVVTIEDAQVQIALTLVKVQGLTKQQHKWLETWAGELKTLEDELKAHQTELVDQSLGVHAFDAAPSQALLNKAAPLLALCSQVHTAALSRKEEEKA